MKRTFRIFVVIIVLLVMSVMSLKAQKTADSVPDYGKEPVWIKMIDSPTTNYYEAIKAFDTYFKFHKKPKDEDAQKSEAEGENGKYENNEADEEYLKSLSAEELNKYAVLKYEVKRFENWIREMKPFVQEDGRILTDSERMEIWKKQQEEAKKQQK